MRQIFISALCIVAIAETLRYAGLPASTWEFWAIFIFMGILIFNEVGE